MAQRDLIPVSSMLEMRDMDSIAATVEAKPDAFVKRGRLLYGGKRWDDFQEWHAQIGITSPLQASSVSE